mmetsp:Transcript_13838/g.20256  ORF Transcript_13838/g.20256 Transcript_13838/m.20256 type:complete len:177 (-) Transcript_13838:237-767(-)
MWRIAHHFSDDDQMSIRRDQSFASHLDNCEIVTSRLPYHQREPVRFLEKRIRLLHQALKSSSGGANDVDKVLTVVTPSPSTCTDGGSTYCTSYSTVSTESTRERTHDFQKGDTPRRSHSWPLHHGDGPDWGYFVDVKHGATTGRQERQSRKHRAYRNFLRKEIEGVKKAGGPSHGA